MSMDAMEVVAALLEKNPTKRLADFEELKEMEWFEDIDWDGIRNRTVVPPYVPELNDEAPDSGEIDLRYFPEEYTSKPLFIPRLDS